MRLFILKIILALLFLVLGFSLFRLQVIKGKDYFRQSENNCLRLVPEDASRGIIYDRNGIALVENRLIFDVVAVFPDKMENKDILFLRLSKILNIDKYLIEDTFNYNSDASFYSVMLAEDVGREAAFLIEQQKSELPGIFIRPRALRYYVYKQAAAHLIGYVGKIPQKDYEKFKSLGYLPGDMIGRAGLEKKLDKKLKGVPGGMQLEVNNKGQIIKVVGYKYPLSGKDVHLTIDIKLQDFIYSLIKDVKGAVGIMDADTGEILSLCSSPAYDPNILMDKKKHKQIKEILQNENALLLNRAICCYPPGSTFKIVTAFAGLAEKKITQTTSFTCNGFLKLGKRKFCCWLERGHGALTIENAFAGSCNVFFYKTGLRLGPELLAKYAAKFGIGQLTGVELPGEQAGFVPDLKWKRDKLRESWYKGDTLNFSIGQGYLLVSPLQELKMVAFVANGGREIFPHLLPENLRQNKRKEVLSVKILSIIRNSMRKVVCGDGGTGHRVNIPGVNIFAKTGTAQSAGAEPHAWFVGYAQIEDKNICFCVFLEHGGHGGHAAAGIAKQIISYLNSKDSRQTE
ncbi:MAG: penicillin-binding protein 2 [Candidatus Omnitrophota bacterium]|nr:MAG: penicillin-binding protein 2 [Candidatus Omnitrophota bacterium]